MGLASLRRFAVIVLGFNLAVIAWGAYVRASGAGAGCGSHWPLCNGVMLPHNPKLATVIELSHRVSSGVGLVLTLLFAVLAFGAVGQGHPLRKSAVGAVGLYFAEALVGAGLVLLKLVAFDPSMAHVLSIGLHLVNTFLLLGALTLNVFFCRAEPRRFSLQAPGRGLVGAALGMTLAVAVSGAVNAMGDTLFPVKTFRAGLAQDLNPASALVLKLRVLHPMLAVGSALFVYFAVTRLRALNPSVAVARCGRAVVALLMLQLGMGLLNLALFAPLSLQLVHLLLADALWILLVLLAAEILLCEARGTPPFFGRGLTPGGQLDEERLPPGGSS